MTEALPPNPPHDGQPTFEPIPLKTEGLTLHGTDSAITGVKCLKSYPADTPIEELKRRYAEDGVLWVGTYILQEPLTKPLC